MLKITKEKKDTKRKQDFQSNIHIWKNHGQKQFDTTIIHRNRKYHFVILIKRKAENRLIPYFHKSYR